MKNKIIYLVISIILVLSITGCSKSSTNGTTSESLIATTTETELTDTDNSSKKETSNLNYCSKIEDVYGDRAIISYEDTKNNQVVYMALNEHDNDIHIQRGKSSIKGQNSNTSVAVSKIDKSKLVEKSTNPQFKYCGIKEDIYGDRAIIVYEDTKYNKVIYIAVNEHDKNTSISVSDLNSNNNIDESLNYIGITDDIYVNRAIITYQDEKHNKIVYLAVHQNNNDTTISVADL